MTWMITFIRCLIVNHIFQASIMCSKSENVELGPQLLVRFENHLLLQVYKDLYCIYRLVM